MFFPFQYFFFSVIFVAFPFLVADVEVKEDGVFIRLRKETVVCEDKDSSNGVSSDVSDPGGGGLYSYGGTILRQPW
jgi:hypothetical protein